MQSVGGEIVTGQVIFYVDFTMERIIFSNYFFFFLPIVHGHPNETEKVGQLIIPAALTQQHSGHFPITKTGTAQRKIYKLG